MPHLPMNRQEMSEYGWDEIDFIFISGDAYVDHPSFGTAILSRVLVDVGFRVGIIAQPVVLDPQSLLVFGRPRLAVLISSGVVDSMVDNYTAACRRRSDDRYAAGGQGGHRPDRALIRYCQMVRLQFGDIPLIIGGIEASLRRFSHYDYWSGQVRHSILVDSQADLLVYGMGESTLLEIAGLLERGVPIGKIRSLPGTAVLIQAEQLPAAGAALLAANPNYRLSPSGKTRPDLLQMHAPEQERFLLLPGHDEVSADRTAYALAFRSQYAEQDPADGKALLQQQDSRFVLQNPPRPPMRQKDLDHVYSLPYMRTPHPRYRELGGVPASEEIRFSINSHRGCYGGCHFCAITFHQGRIVQARSQASVLAEAKILTEQPDFKGYIHDVGGPTANFHQPACVRQDRGAVCKHRQCLYPAICPSLRVDHGPYLDLLRQVRSLPGVKKVFIRSGIRFDTVLLDKKNDFLTELCRYHVSGQLKIAPEHVSPAVLAAMGKPGSQSYRTFVEKYQETNRTLGLRQYLVPYLISGHPGSTLSDAIDLAMEIKNGKVMPEQVQDFYPTPGTVSTTMYYTGLNPLTLEPVHVPKGEEKVLQRALLQPGKPSGREKVLKALRMAGRTDLIGNGPGKLISA